jgi:putative ABC transport system permease protein
MPESTFKLPPLELFCLRALLPGSDFGYLIGFYEQGFQDQLGRGPLRARSWLWLQILKAAPALIRSKIRGEKIMLWNYLKTALRNILRHKGYSAINIAGLAIGLASCLLIFIWVKYEWSCDRYHANAEDIHQVVIQWPEGERTRWARVTPPPLAAELVNDYPEVRNAVVFKTQERILVEYENRTYSETIGFSEPALFEIFTIPLVAGNPEAALSDPASVVISERTARKYFGTEEPLGKSLTIHNELTLKVSAVMQDIPENSVLHCPILVSFQQHKHWAEPLMSWGHYAYSTFVHLDEGTDAEGLSEKLYGYMKEKDEVDDIFLSLQPLTRIHLYALEGGGPILYVYIFTAVAVFILLIACINFMNLATARSATRMREIGVRKVVGADRKKLILQFLGESIFMSLVSFVIAVLLSGLLLKPLRHLAEIPASQPMLQPGILPLFLALAVLTGLMAGCYPALFLSSFRPANILKGKQKSGSPVFRKVLVVFQFTISIILLICMFLVSSQIDYLGSKTLGFSREHIVYFPLNSELEQQYLPLQQELLQAPGVVCLSGTSNYIGKRSKWSSETNDWEGKDPERSLNLYMISVDPSFAETFEIEMAEGRFFSEEFSQDGQNFILNETAIKATGLESPLGKKFQVFDIEGTIIGVVKDFHFRSLHMDVQPLLLTWRPDWHDFMAVKIAAENTPETLAAVETVFKRMSPKFPFEFHFLDDTLDMMYHDELRSRSLFRYFVGLAVFISCLGLLGLASFMVQKRTKEIGVRKVLGASVPGVVMLLTQEYTRWILLANVFAWPAAYLIMKSWLRNFAYRINIGIEVFFIAALVTLGIAVLTVGLQTLKAALADPISALRYE